MSTILHGFEYNDATTPAPWGPRETVWNRQMINTLVMGTVGGAMDEAGHKHYRVYDEPTGNVVFDSTTLSAYSSRATVTATGTTGGQTSTMVMSGSAYTSSTIAIATGLADNTHLAEVRLNSGYNTAQSTDRGMITLGVGGAYVNQPESGSATIIMAAKTLNDAPYVNIDAGSSSIHSETGLVDIIAGTTDTSHARIILNGAAGTSNSISMYVDSDSVRGGDITLQAGYHGGLNDVPIRILTDNAVVLGRAVGTDSNLSTLQANFGGVVTIKSWTSSLSLYGYEGITMDTPKLGAVTKITGDASVVKNLHVDGDIYTVALTEYADSSVEGLSGTPTQSVWYSKVGKQVHCWYTISGTSNAQNLSFTLPYAATTAPSPVAFKNLVMVINDSTAVTGTYSMSDSTVLLYKNLAGDGFTATGVKGSEGYVTYLTA